MMTTRRTLSLAVATVVVVTVLIGGALFTWGRHSGQGSAAEAAAAYVAALGKKSAGDLASVADPDSNASAVIPGLVSSVSPGPLVVTSLVEQPTENDHLVAFDLTGTLRGAPYSSRIFVRNADGGFLGWHSGWFVVLGPAPGGNPQETRSTP